MLTSGLRCKRGLVVGRCVVALKSLRRGDLWGVLDQGSCGGLRGALLCLEGGAALRVGDLNLCSRHYWHLA